MADVRHMTATVTLARLLTEWLCYVLGRLQSSYVLITRMGLHRIELIYKTLVNDDYSILFLNFLSFYLKSHTL